MTEVIYSPTLPAAALSLVVVPTIPGNVAPLVCKVASAVVVVVPGVTPFIVTYEPWCVSVQFSAAIKLKLMFGVLG
jgi:hypothetical protein